MCVYNGRAQEAQWTKDGVSRMADAACRKCRGNKGNYWLSRKMNSNDNVSFYRPRRGTRNYDDSPNERLEKLHRRRRDRRTRCKRTTEGSTRGSKLTHALCPCTYISNKNYLALFAISIESTIIVIERYEKLLQGQNGPTLRPRTYISNKDYCTFLSFWYTLYRYCNRAI